ncbi:hypothetical protein [Streptomyces sp. NPDC102437]|uniref:hypothetical protein n=1 Tax=Streptomyces sp. NPDC102437 TaxID=3366175 RepID=UPI0037FEE0E1
MWDAVAAISGLVSAVVVIVACVYAASQLRETREARALSSLLSIHQEYQAPALRRTRRLIRDGHLDVTSIQGEDRHSLDDLLQKLELVAFLSSRKLVQLEDVVALFPSIPLVVSEIRPYIDQRRLTNPTYAEHALTLASKYP